MLPYTVGFAPKQPEVGEDFGHITIPRVHYEGLLLRIKQLERQVSNDSWLRNPDRMGS
jgi:hypothetical protein